MTEIQEATTETLRPPAFGDVIVSPTGAADDLPVPVAPYYRIYENGTFLHRPTAFGHGLIPFTKKPRRLKKFEHTGGFFRFTGPQIPATIMAQAIAFFRRILAEKNSEAEVLITQNWETGEHRLFIPTQWASKGGVRSLYDPRHIAQGYLVIGTIHSHCDFSPRHSGIDETDARAMDGVHLIAGMLQNEIPSYDAMVSLDKVLFEYTPEAVAELPTAEQIAETTAPAWWDRYLRPHSPTDAERPAFASDDDWDRIMGRYKPKWQVTPATRQLPAPSNLPVVKPLTATNHTKACLEYVGKTVASELTPDDWDNYLYQKPVAARPAEPKKTVDTTGWDDGDWALAMEYGWVWDSATENFVNLNDVEGGLQRLIDLHRDQRMNSEDLLPGGPVIPADFREDEDDEDEVDRLAVYEFYQDYWEDVLGGEFVDSLYNTGLIGDDDIDDAMEAGDLSFTPEWWEARMKSKILTLVTWLGARGYTAKISFTPPKRPLPGQTEAFPEIADAKKGAHV